MFHQFNPPRLPVFSTRGFFARRWSMLLNLKKSQINDITELKMVAAETYLFHTKKNVVVIATLHTQKKIECCIYDITEKRQTFSQNIANNDAEGRFVMFL